jgi:hypothetical protein
VLEEPRVHAPGTHGRLQKGVGVSIRLAEGVSPRDLSRGRMFCWRRRKNTMIYYFFGFARYCIARRAKLKMRPT